MTVIFDMNRLAEVAPGSIITLSYSRNYIYIHLSLVEPGSIGRSRNFSGSKWDRTQKKVYIGDAAKQDW